MRHQLTAAALCLAVAASPALSHAGVDTTTTSRVAASTASTARQPIANTHIDAAHVHWADGRLAIGVIKGTTLVSADSVYLNLQNAVDSSGTNLARFTVPQGPLASKLSFLGAPGTSYWYSPQQYNDGWHPMWTGFGADVPDDKIVEGSLRLELVSAQGPSWVECFFSSGFGDGFVRRFFSTRDAAFASQAISNHDHGHPGWAFGAPGTYTLNFRATGTTPQGQKVTSAVQPIVWQVGPGTPRV